MKSLILGFLLTFILTSITPSIFAQQYNGKIEKKDGKEYIDGLPLFTNEDFKVFGNLPELKLPKESKTRNLPEVVDNSARPWFRPIFDQVALECGQASGVAYTYTYEINRLRDLPSNVIENQYPTHFVYNWSGNGSGNASSFFDSWNIIKYAGTPNALEYGGSLSYGGSARWINGYDMYYSALKNRLWDFYSIDVTNEEGLNTLKHWIANHLNGEESGGVGNIYTSAIGAGPTLPTGTPEAGKHVVLELPSYSNHALCIVGYHDSIRYDINNDGQYTNDLDINNDGEINILDWEMGGVKLANSYYASTWGDGGFAYLLYSGLCRKMVPQGGPWNGMVHVVKAKENTDPQITFKVTITHDSRNKIKVMAGVATTPGATEPEFIIDFPILSYQGGDKFMTGGSNTEDKTLEFGIDVTPLLDHVGSGEEARFFLLVNEKDPYNGGTGMINNFSLMDYTFGTNEIQCAQTSVQLNENDLTMLYVDANISFEKPGILNDELPAGIVNEPYQNQMLGFNGTEPYQWKVKQTYTSQQGIDDFPAITGEQLTPNNQTSGFAEKEIAFDFPFYGKTYDKVYLHTDGYLLFNDDNYPWIFLIDQQNLLKNMRNISPMMSKTLQVQGGGSMWYEGNSTKATFRWNTREYSTDNEQNFALSIYPDGKIELYYGEYLIANYNKWFAGMSDGDDFNTMILDISNTQLEPNTKITLEPQYMQTELSINENGLLQGTPTHPYEAIDMEFYLKDANGMQNTKELVFSTDGVNDIVIRDVFIQSGDNSIIEYGETAVLSIELKNISENTVEASEMMIITSDEYISLTDSLEYLESFEPGETRVIENAFAFDVSDEVPDGHNIVLSSAIESGAVFYNSYIYLEAFTPELSIGSAHFEDDNNGHPEPGEIVQLFVNIKNTGGGRAYNVVNELSINDPFLTVLNTNYTIDQINGGTTATAEFEIEINENTPMGYTSNFEIEALANNNYSASGTVAISVGFIFEDFETGDFSQYEWEFSGDADWLIDNFDPYEGVYCMKSGDIEDDQSSTISITMDILLDNTISFYYLVSSENNYDYLRFSIDGSVLGQWSGEDGWGLASYPVNTGEHTFTWSFDKDYSVSSGFDAGFIDYVMFPPSGQVEMAVSAGPNLNICEGESATTQAFIVNAESIEWTTSGDGTFSDITIINPLYTPGEEDIFYGTVDLTVTAWDYSGTPVSDYTTLFIHHLPIISAGDDLESCDYMPYVGISGIAINTDEFFWFTSGDGTFTNSSALSTKYYPGYEDLMTGEVELSLNAYAQAPCEGQSSDDLMVVFWPAPEVSFDTLPLLGLNSPPYQLTEGSPPGGVYSGPGVTNGWLYPEVAGIGVHTLNYKFVDANGCENHAEQVVTIDEFVAIAEAGDSKIKIVPNPGNGVFYIYPNAQLSGKIIATIFNPAGNKILTREFTEISATQKLEINCIGQPAGVYYLHLRGDKEAVIRKLIIY